MTLISDTTRRTRKAHTCDLCAEAIPPGATYRRSVWRDGSVWTWVEHLGCAALGRAWLAWVADVCAEGYDGDAIREWIWEEGTHDVLAHTDLSGLSAEEQERVRAWVERIEVES